MHIRIPLQGCLLLRSLSLACRCSLSLFQAACCCSVLLPSLLPSGGALSLFRVGLCCGFCWRLLLQWQYPLALFQVGLPISYCAAFFLFYLFLFPGIYMCFLCFFFLYADKPAGALNGGRPLSIALSQDHLLCPMIQIPHTAAHQPSDLLLHPSRLCTTGSTTLFMPHRCLSQPKVGLSICFLRSSISFQTVLVMALNITRLCCYT